MWPTDNMTFFRYRGRENSGNVMISNGEVTQHDRFLTTVEPQYTEWNSVQNMASSVTTSHNGYSGVVQHEEVIATDRKEGQRATEDSCTRKLSNSCPQQVRVVLCRQSFTIPAATGLHDGLCVLVSCKQSQTHQPCSTQISDTRYQPTLRQPITVRSTLPTGCQKAVKLCDWLTTCLIYYTFSQWRWNKALNDVSSHTYINHQKTHSTLIDWLID